MAEAKGPQPRGAVRRPPSREEEMDRTSPNQRRGDALAAPEDRAGAPPATATPAQRPGVIAFWIKIN
jgi:hypothetical protein